MVTGTRASPFIFTVFLYLKAHKSNTDQQIVRIAINNITTFSEIIKQIDRSISK